MDRTGARVLVFFVFVLLFAYQSLKLETAIIFVGDVALDSEQPITAATTLTAHSTTKGTPSSIDHGTLSSSSFVMGGNGEPCWLDPQWGLQDHSTINNNSNISSSDISGPPTALCIGNPPVIANTSAIGLTCMVEDNQIDTGGSETRRCQRQSWHPREDEGITIALLYYAQPSMLIYQLKKLDEYPIGIQRQLTLLIVDDGSPDGLRASEYVNRDQPNRYYRIRLVRVMKDKAWNIGGARNLAFHVIDTQRALLLDLDMWIPVETIQQVLEGKTFNGTHQLAHRFNRKRLNGSTGKHPAVCLIDADAYWRAGGCDEDFVGNYGFTDVHFWYRWKADPSRIIVEHLDSFLIEYEHENVCDSAYLQQTQLSNLSDTMTTLSLEQLAQKCNDALSTLKIPGKWGQKINKARVQKKRTTGCWSNEYLRFPWIMEW